MSNVPNKPNLILVDICKIHPSPFNKCLGDRADVTELAASIQSSGLLQSPIVRNHPSLQDEFELVVGERRVRACNLIWTQMYVDLREYTDEQAYSATMIENLQRKGLNPVEEAESISALHGMGCTNEEIADKIGKTAQWVARRSKLINLSDKVKSTYFDPKDETGVSKWSSSHLELIARFDHGIQDDYIANRGIHYWASDDYDQIETLSSLKESLDRFLKKLANVPWKLSDSDLLPEAGSCDSCQKRTACQVSLFDQTEEKGKVVDQCIDPVCFESKLKLFVSKKESDLSTKNPDLVKLYSGRLDDDLSGTAVSIHSVTECKKSDPGARQALIVSGDGAGSTKWVKTPSKEKPEVSYEDKHAKLNKRRMIKVIDRVMTILNDEIKCPNIIKGVSDENAFTIAIVFGTRRYESVMDEPDFDRIRDMWIQFSVYQQRTPAVDLIHDLIRCTLPGWVSILKANQDDKPVTLDFAENVCEFLGLDFKEIVRQVELEIKVPKSWEKEDNVSPDASESADKSDNSGDSPVVTEKPWRKVKKPTFKKPAKRGKK